MIIMIKRFKNVGNSVLHLGEINKVVAVGKEFSVDVVNKLPRDVDLFIQAGFLHEVTKKTDTKEVKATTKNKPTKEAKTKETKVEVKKYDYKPETETMSEDTHKDIKKETVKDKYTSKNSKAKSKSNK